MCACERESSKAARRENRQERERGSPNGNKGRRKYVGGRKHMKGDRFGKKIMLVLFPGSISVIGLCPTCDITHAEWRVSAAQRKGTIPGPNPGSSAASPDPAMPAL